ncbi:MAG: class I SAM-dependent methyltransferase [Oligoflexia bacterium]|nr:class I SAM-dependent methyltransferase [Oligoflexia bacterium]
MNKPTYGKDFWDQRYDTESYLYGINPNDFLVSNLSLLKKGGNILCLSEGEGRNAVFLASKGFKVTAVDLSTVAKEKALKLAAKNNVEIEYVVSDLKDYDLGVQKWDGIVSIFGHTPSLIRKNLHQRIKKALKNEGVLILEGYNIEQLKNETGGPKDQDMLYAKEELEDAFKDLVIQTIQNLVRNVNEGLAHNGEASVTQLVAIKGNTK